MSGIAIRAGQSRGGASARCLVVAFTMLLVTGAEAQGPADQLDEARKSLERILDMPEGVPQDLLDKAECVVILPSVIKAGFIVGGSYGKGAMTCRQGGDYTGSWGPPSIYRLEQGSIGFQIGGAATEYLLLVMNQSGAESIMKSNAKLGGDASVAAGPKGRTGSAGTDLTMRAEVLSYSRSRGVFAGVSLEGGTLRPDNDDNESLYGTRMDVKDIVIGGKVASPPAAEGLLALLRERSPENRSDEQ